MALDEKYLRQLADKDLGPEWESLATRLGFSYSDIFKISNKEKSIRNKIFRMLVQWRQKQSSEIVACQKLIDALKHVGRYDLAGGVQENLGLIREKWATYPKCLNHDVVRLFCMTCHILFCRNCEVKRHREPEHVSVKVPLANATRDEFSKFLRSVLKEIGESRREVSVVKSQLKATAKRVEAEVRATAEGARKWVTTLEDGLVEKIRNTHEDRKLAMEKIDSTLSALSERTQKSLETAAHVTNTSDGDSLCSSIIKDLELMMGLPSRNVSNIADLSFEKHGIADVKLGKLLCAARGRWMLCREFGKEGSDRDEFVGARDVTALPQGRVAVADNFNKRVVIYSINGDYERCIPFKDEGPTAITVSQPGNRLVVACSPSVKVFNDEYLEALTFATVGEAGTVHVHLHGVAVRKNGNILVGDALGNVLTEHNPTDGSCVRTIQVEIGASFMAVDSNDDTIIISSFDEGVVHVADCDGATSFIIKPTIRDRPVKHCGGVWSGSLGIFVAAKNTQGIGHIHHYDAQGNFLACIAKGLYDPQGIAVTTDGQLVVADRKSIKIYQQQV